VIFIETHAYSLGWSLGLERAVEEFRHQCLNPDNKSLPCVRTITRLRQIAEVQLWFDCGSTRLAESRCRAVHEAINSQCDLYFSCDDDCEARADAIAWMVEAVQGKPNVCLAPYWARLSQLQTPRICLNLPDPPEGQSRTFRHLSNGGLVTPARQGGMGLVCASMDAMRRIVAANNGPGTEYTDIEGVTRNALFIEYIRDGYWMGEDLAFFSKIPPDVTVEALMTGVTSHAGQKLDLQLLQTTRAELEALIATGSPTPESN
jgi:hypothetical protein